MSNSIPSEDDLKEIVRRIFKEYNGNFPLDFYIRDTQEEFYGPEATQEKIGIIDGAYLPKRRAVQLVRNNLPNHRRAERAIRHELLGHYGLNTLRADEKRTLLERIIEAREEPSLKPLWQTIDKTYPHHSPLIKAEEVFASVAENEPSLTPPVQANTVLSTPPSNLLTLQNLEQEAARVADGIRHGELQKTFPETDSAQFRRFQKAPIKHQQAPFQAQANQPDTTPPAADPSTRPINYSVKATLRTAYLTRDKKEAIAEFPQLEPVYAFEQVAGDFVAGNKPQFSQETEKLFVERIRENALDVLARGETLRDRLPPLSAPHEEQTSKHEKDMEPER